MPAAACRLERAMENRNENERYQMQIVGAGSDQDRVAHRQVSRTGVGVVTGRGETRLRPIWTPAKRFCCPANSARHITFCFLLCEVAFVTLVFLYFYSVSCIIYCGLFQLAFLFHALVLVVSLRNNSVHIPC